MASKILMRSALVTLAVGVFTATLAAQSVEGQPSVMGFLYDVNAAWNFGQRQFLNARFSPYLVVGAGGLTSEIRDGSAAFVNGGGTATGPAHVLHDRDTFFDG